MRTTVLSLAVGLLVGSPALAGDGGCCSRCGAAKTCQVVCEMKTVKKTVWVVECQDVCTALPGCVLGCRRGCDGCGADENCGQRCGRCNPCDSLSKCMAPPKCGSVRSVKKLVKKEIEYQVPTYRCVAVCCGCGCGQGGCDPEKGPAEAAPAPAPARSTTDVAPWPPLAGPSYLEPPAARP